ncbi:hypothetical protein, partial [Pseudosulfitobacter pseudonitzschiae]|uniref:hypothetical protein n=1 Tax=Pseudosulfitobacter pseudonitzschiae TaxID=1402135 RepID=UPI001CC95CCC
TASTNSCPGTGSPKKPETAASPDAYGAMAPFARHSAMIRLNTRCRCSVSARRGDPFDKAKAARTTKGKPIEKLVPQTDGKH